MKKKFQQPINLIEYKPSQPVIYNSFCPQARFIGYSYSLPMMNQGINKKILNVVIFVIAKISYAYWYKGIL